MILGCVNLVLLGIGISATNPRRASNWNLLFALLAFIVYFNLINLTQTWVVGNKMKLGPALMALHGGAFLVTLLLLLWREQGARLGARAAACCRPRPRTRRTRRRSSPRPRPAW